MTPPTPEQLASCACPRLYASDCYRARHHTAPAFDDAFDDFGPSDDECCCGCHDNFEQELQHNADE